MTTPRDPRTHVPHRAQPPDPHSPAKHRGHGWMMIACCVPMLVIAIVLVATGVVGISFVVVAIMCTLMMAMMMGGMGRDSDGPR
jgi:Flp pilus assembly protein TadB